jgi:hypothetical protein
MSRSILRTFVLSVAVVGGWATSSSASAATWTASSVASFSATAGASQLQIRATAGTVGVSCTSASSNGNATALVGAPYPGTWSNAAAIRPAFTGCTAAGLPATVKCNTTGAPITGAASLNAVTANGSPVTTVNGNVSGIGCSVAVTGCSITVSSTGTVNHAVDALYTNTSSFGIYGNVAGHLQTLTSSWPGNSTCNAIFGTTGTSGGSAASYFGAGTLNAGGYPNDLVYAVSGGPTISHS